MKNLLNLKGVVALGREQLKIINGGNQARCSSACPPPHLIQGHIGECYWQGDCNCPGICTGGAGCQVG